MWQRKIIHIDMDAFFAAIEVRDNPALRGKPVVVGGDPFGRGVVSTASYEARRFGIHSAMASAEARRLCPGAVFLRPNFRKYEEASRSIRAVLHQHTDLVEPASLDEAYLDVTMHRLGMKDPVLVASIIKQNIFAVTKLTASAGVAPNLYLAKIASDLKKPNGLTVVRPTEVKAFLRDLPVRKIPGVGPVTESRLKALGVGTCGELLELKLAFLIERFGKSGVFLHDRARGIDDSAVTPETTPKQISVEETFERDTKNTTRLKMFLEEFSKTVFLQLRQESLIGRTVVLKVKYFDFEQITRSRTLETVPRDAGKIYEVACELLETKTLAGKKPVRLLGVGISGLSEVVPETNFPQDLFLRTKGV
jgi:DNA polymerase-4